MREVLWDRKSKQSIQEFLENMRSMYDDLLQDERNKSNRDVKLMRHLKQVVEELQEIKNHFQIKDYTPAYKPVCKGLNIEKRKAHFESPGKFGDMLDFLVKHHHKLHWQYGYNNLSEGLQRNFAFGEVLGSMAPIVPKKINLGFVLLSPGTNYPKHVHEGVDELYLNIGATCEINDNKVFYGECYHVISGLPHKIRSSKEEMGILLYTWIFPSGNPGKYGMRFLE